MIDNHTSQQNNINLIPIKKQCDNSHRHCIEIVQRSKKSSEPITSEYFNDFIKLVSPSSYYSNCISQYNNSKHMEIKKFILTHSKKIKINNWENFTTYITDNDFYEILLNQHTLEPNLITYLVNLDMVSNQNKFAAGTFPNFLNSLMIQQKYKSFEYIMMSITLNDFSKYLNKIPKNFIQGFENIIIKFISKNSNEFKEKNNIPIGIQIINTFITRPNILMAIYPMISENINTEYRKEIFHKCISSFDKNFILTMLESEDIKPNIDTINRLIEKSYFRPDGSTNAKQVAEIIDLLCDYGLIVNKEIVIKLLEKGCYVNNLEKHEIKIDNEILAKCANISYYPYKFDIIPNVIILKKECSKHDNLDTIKKLKEFGGIYTTECLEEACSIPKNGKVIKYLIMECGVEISDACLEKFQQAYKIEVLDTIMKKYKSQNSIKTNEIKEDNIKKFDANGNVELDQKSTMFISPRNINIDIRNNQIDYELKNKVRKFFEYKKKTIKYNELFELFLKYIISNKLVIGKYFVIDIPLSNLLKINHCVIIDTNQIHNILSYFIDLPTIENK